MGLWILSGIGVSVAGATVAVLIGRSVEAKRADDMEAALLHERIAGVDHVLDVRQLSDLPAPVRRYFEYCLVESQKLIKTVRIHQMGELRTSTTSELWSSFTAEQLVAPSNVGFVWKAKVSTPFATHVRVLDGYLAGVGTGSVSLLSAFRVASDSDKPELNSGALHRYLAEAVRYPTALLPGSGVTWAPVDDHTAIATLSDNGITVSLEFRFNDTGEVLAIYTPTRFGRFEGTYKQVPWEGHFKNYQNHQGIRVPSYGEVAWYDDEDTLQLVWKGDLLDLQYEFE